jgi:uncharacterized lipoprotein
MLKLIKQRLGLTLLFILFAVSSGCALSPQIIAIETHNPLLERNDSLGRSALVRVRDLRADTEILGNRGGSNPEQAPLLAKPKLQQALTEKMQNSLQDLGFGGSSPFEPLKLDLAVKTFLYQCNTGAWVSQCDLTIQVELSIDNEGQSFSQPFKIKQQRSVATAPRVGYNTEWINQALDKLWSHMLSQPQVVQALDL